MVVTAMVTIGAPLVWVTCSATVSPGTTANAPVSALADTVAFNVVSATLVVMVVAALFFQTVTVSVSAAFALTVVPIRYIPVKLHAVGMVVA